MLCLLIDCSVLPSSCRDNDIQYALATHYLPKDVYSRCTSITSGYNSLLVINKYKLFAGPRNYPENGTTPQGAELSQQKSIILMKFNEFLKISSLISSVKREQLTRFKSAKELDMN